MFGVYFNVSKLTTDNHKRVFNVVPLFLKDISDIIPVQLVSKARLICIHSFYVRILCQTRISASELDNVIDMIHFVQRQGAEEYRGTTGLKHDKEWITINSHLMRHIKWYVKQFGIPRNFWVFAFESMLGEVKRFNARHKNHQSEGSSMFQYQLDRVLFNVLLYATEPESYNAESYVELFMRNFCAKKKNQVVSVAHSYDSESDYYVVKRVDRDGLPSILVNEIDVEFDGLIKVEWSDLVTTGPERYYSIESIDCCYDTLLVSGRHYLLNKSINN
jgi:hypothetical protein